MPFTDTVSNMSGRNSRASNMSGNTGASRSARSQQPPVPPLPAGADTLNNAGVLSMLKTSTDTGDIGALSFNKSQLPGSRQQAHQRRAHPARLSGGSHGPVPGHAARHHYAPSQTSRISSTTRDFDTTSNGRRGSFTSLQTMPPPPPVANPARDSRSYSMSNAHPPRGLPHPRSVTSLKSQGHEPRHGHRHHLGHPPPVPDMRGPYIYPTRLKRPGYRSPSPAFSEGYGQPPPPPPTIPQQPHMNRRMPMPRPPMPTYNSDYGADYGHDAALLHVRPPPRAMPTPNMAPPMDPNHYAYQPRPMRSNPTMQMQHPAYRPPHPAYYHGYGPPPPPPHPASGYPMQHPAYRGPPPPAHSNPMAHNIFHNAARMARHLPQRTDTPLTDLGLSSEPPSSGSAPTSSNPPTPKDSTGIQVQIDPAYIDPSLADLVESTSEPMLPAHYIAYAEASEKQLLEEEAVEPHHPSAPPNGFVQRVRAMLESKAAVEAHAKVEADHERARQQHQQPQPQQQLQQHHAIVYEEPIHELAADRLTLVEEFDAPVELPASPVKVPELDAGPVPTQHLTRALVKAELGPSSGGLNESGLQSIEGTLTGSELKLPEPRQATPEAAKVPVDEPTDVEISAVNEGITEDTDMPSSPPSIKHGKQPSVSESAADTSITAVRCSGMDYALRFSMPDDSAIVDSTETDSRDPFMLDAADTITAQHQGGIDFAKTPEPRRVLQDPVSPLLDDEVVRRSSAVSPLHTQTLGLDETIMIGAHSDDTPSKGDAQMPGTFPDESENKPPATPRATNRYSKSVQLEKPSMTVTDTTNTNRYSLPPDLSQIGDATMNSTDMITDVAVRFSMPQTTITVGKPQIVSISSTASSATPSKNEPALPRPAFQSTNTKPPRQSVTFEDQVAPLNINKRLEKHRQSLSAGDVLVAHRKPVTRRASPLDNITEVNTPPADRDSTTDLRFSNINFHGHAKYPSTHLPGLKEESVEDMSISDQKRKSDIASDFQFPLPARIAAVKAMQERRHQQQKSRDEARAMRGSRNPNRTLAEIRDLPSLNFSHMDLIDKLNGALECRSSKSMDVIRRRDFSGIYCPSPQRPASTEPLRERYTSFFDKPEDFEFLDDLDEDELEEQKIDEAQSAAAGQEDEGQGGGEVVVSGSRPLSPEDLLQFATQVNRLSIPSVNGLSERLSELLPSLRKLHLDSILAEGEIEHTIEDIQHLGQGGEMVLSRPGTVLSNRTSAGFRTLAERAEEIVLNGTHDSIGPFVAIRPPTLNKDLPSLPESLSAGRVSPLTSLEARQALTGSVSAPSDLGAPIRPHSALMRTRSPATIEEVNLLLPPESNPIARSKRSLVLSSPSSRPWNLDENYPWAGSKVEMDLSVPLKAYYRDSVTGGTARGTRSLDLTSRGEITATTQGIDIGSIRTSLERTASITTEQLTGVPSSHKRKQSKLSIIGSISKRMGLRRGDNHIDDSTKATLNTTCRSLPTSPHGVRASDDLPHIPGERYPSTGLTPPANFNIDEVRSFFSDNSSEKSRHNGHSRHNTHTTNPRKRKTLLKGKMRDKSDRHNTLTTGARPASFDIGPYAAGALLDERFGAGSSANTHDGVGMGRAEFRIKRFGEKLRHLFAKGGDLVRSWSTGSRSARAKKPDRGADAETWLSDSVYSGV